MMVQHVLSSAVWFYIFPVLVFAKTPLYILGLYPLTGAWDGGVSFLPATQLALEHINANESLLVDYELILIDRDTGVSNDNVSIALCMFYLFNFILLFFFFFALLCWFR